MIEINNLSTGYRRDSPVMESFSYQFTNKIYGILGKSGCGKTTFLRTVAGLRKPLSREIVLDGERITKPNKNICMMHQNYTSFDWLSVLKNVLIAQEIQGHVSLEDKNRAEEILKRVGLIEHKGKFPTQLSGGQRQRLALARTLFIRPKVILMDEPLSALDEVTRKKMQELIKEVQRDLDSTIILVTHSPDEANRMCDEIINF